METITLSHSAAELSTWEVSFVLVKDGNYRAVLSVPQTQFFQAIDADDATEQLFWFYGAKNVRWLSTAEVLTPIGTPEERQEAMLGELALKLVTHGISLHSFVSSARILGVL